MARGRSATFEYRLYETASKVEVIILVVLALVVLAIAATSFAAGRSFDVWNLVILSALVLTSIVIYVLYFGLSFTCVVSAEGYSLLAHLGSWTVLRGQQVTWPDVESCIIESRRLRIQIVGKRAFSLPKNPDLLHVVMKYVR